MFVDEKFKKENVNSLDNINLLSNFHYSDYKVEKFFQENYSDVAPKEIICTKCKGSSFKNNDELKIHYKTPWHELNIKRISSELESLTLEDYIDSTFMSGDKEKK